MKRQRHKKKTRPLPEKSPGMIFVSQGACKREKSFRESRKGLANEKNPPGSLARGLQDGKFLPGVSQVTCKLEKTFRDSRKGLARENNPSGGLARGLQERKILSGVSQVACKRERPNYHYILTNF